MDPIRENEKEYIKETKNAMSGTGGYFICSGIVYLAGNLVIEAFNFFSDPGEALIKAGELCARFVPLIVIALCALIFAVFYRKAAKEGNDLSRSLLKMWGVLIIGGQSVIRLFFYCYGLVDKSLKANTVNALIQSAFYMVILIGFLLMGLIVHDRAMIIGIIVCVALFFVLLCSNINLIAEHSHGENAGLKDFDLLTCILNSFSVIYIGLCLGFWKEKKKTSK